MPASTQESAMNQAPSPPWVKPLVIIAALLAVVFTYPRLIVSWLGEDNPWTSYLYLYGLGLIVFVIGITLILRTGACQLGRGRDSGWFKVLIGGYIFFATLHAVWIIAAQQIPFLGEK